MLDDPAKAYDADLWKAVGAQGWLGAAIPEEFGGLGLGHIELCAIAEELGRPFLINDLEVDLSSFAGQIESQPGAVRFYFRKTI